MSEPAHVTFEALGVPVPQGSKVAFLRHGRVAMRESSADRLKAWRGDVEAAARRARRSRDAMTGPVIADMAFSFPRPRAHYGRGRNALLLKPSAPHHHTQTPDVDKLARAIGDALTIASVIVDDKQIVVVHASKHWAHAGQMPGVIVTVTRVDAVDAGHGRRGKPAHEPIAHATPRMSLNVTDQPRAVVARVIVALDAAARRNLTNQEGNTA